LHTLHQKRAKNKHADPNLSSASIVPCNRVKEANYPTLIMAMRTLSGDISKIRLTMMMMPLLHPEAVRSEIYKYAPAGWART